MSYIIEGLYAGDQNDAHKASVLRKRLGITHILTVESKPLSMDARNSFVYKYVHVLDMEDFDLLSHLEDCLQFIEEARKDGAILVHCYAGESRSGAVVVAYVMRTFQLALTEALALVQKQRPNVGPNVGFQRQLELFESMGFRVDLDSTEYKKYRLGILAVQMQNAHERTELPSNCLSVDPSLAPVGGTDAVYWCRKCRRALFRESGVMSHAVGVGSAVFRHQPPGHRTSTSPDTTGTPCKQSLFIQPVAWMQYMILSLHGKLSCPKCKAKIGSFHWAGEHCPCGTWVTPAFHVQTSKVDLGRTVVLRPPSRPSVATTSRSSPVSSPTRLSESSNDETVSSSRLELVVVAANNNNNRAPVSCEQLPPLK